MSYILLRGFKMTEAQILDALRWLARQNPDVQLAIWKQAYGDQAEHERKKLAHAVLVIKGKMHRDKRKYSDREAGLQELQETTELRIKALKKPRKRTERKSRLKRKVKLRIKLIDKLKSEEGLGWRLIARYLERYADLKISHAQLRRLYLQIKEEETNNG